MKPETLIADMQLSTRIKNCCRNQGLITVADVWRENETLARVSNLGPMSLHELRLACGIPSKAPGYTKLASASAHFSCKDVTAQWEIQVKHIGGDIVSLYLRHPDRQPITISIRADAVVDLATDLRREAKKAKKLVGQ